MTCKRSKSKVSMVLQKRIQILEGEPDLHKKVGGENTKHIPTRPCALFQTYLPVGSAVPTRRAILDSFDYTMPPWPLGRDAHVAPASRVTQPTVGPPPDEVAYCAKATTRLAHRVRWEEVAAFVVDIDNHSIRDVGEEDVLSPPLLHGAGVHACRDTCCCCYIYYWWVVVAVFAAAPKQGAAAREAAEVLPQSTWDKPWYAVDNIHVAAAEEDSTLLLGKHVVYRV